jgi:hypothetical protein
MEAEPTLRWDALQEYAWPSHLPQNNERRIQAVVKGGAYHSAHEALDAGIAVVETTAALGFEGTQEELEQLS